MIAHLYIIKYKDYIYNIMNQSSIDFLFNVLEQTAPVPHEERTNIIKNASILQLEKMILL